MKTARLIIFPSEPGLISRSCREKNGPHSFRAVLIYVATVVCHLSNAAVAGAAAAVAGDCMRKAAAPRGRNIRGGLTPASFRTG